MGEKAEKTSSLRDNNYYTVQGWMINKLGLKGTELQLYAIIYGFSQTDGQVFSGAAQYLADWTNISRRNVMERLRSLTEKGFIVKEDVITNGVKMCKYRCRPLEALGHDETSQGDMTKHHSPYDETSQGDVMKHHSPYDETAHNIYSINNSDIQLDKKDNSGAPAPIPSHPPDGKSKGKKTGIDTEAIFRRYTQDENVLSLLRDWLEVRKAKHATATERALTLNLDKLPRLAQESGLSVPQYLEQVIMRGWAAFFPINNWGKPTPARPIVKTEADHAAGGHASGFGW